MYELLEKLCNAGGVSGNEDEVRNIILSEISDCCEVKTDNSGNIIAFKKGRKRPAHTLMIDAHMDEVGLIITDVTPDGFLKFSTVGGIKESVLISKRVMIGKISGVIGIKPVHLSSAEERKHYPKESNLCIDIGAMSREEALEKVSYGDYASFENEFVLTESGLIKSKALDDRVGCFVLINLLKKESEYDFYATFTVNEEVGLKGAKCAADFVNPDFAVILEGTTASDIEGVPEEKTVTKVGFGPAVSFMDRSALYDNGLINAVKTLSVKYQIKRAVAGGNNAGAVHVSHSGVRTVAVSVPCRYIHSPSSVCSAEDIENAYLLAEKLKDYICSGEVK